MAVMKTPAAPPSSDAQTHAARAKAEREARLAAALRTNLRRRKTGARAADGGADSDKDG